MTTDELRALRVGERVVLRPFQDFQVGTVRAVLEKVVVADMDNGDELTLFLDEQNRNNPCHHYHLHFLAEFGGEP